MSQSVVSRFWVQSGQEVLFVESGIVPCEGDRVVMIPSGHESSHTEAFSSETDPAMVYGRVILSVTLQELLCINLS